LPNFGCGLIVRITLSAVIQRRRNDRDQQRVPATVGSGELGSLKLALSYTFGLHLLIPYIEELRGLFARLELKLLRGTAAEILELLKKGEAGSPIARLGKVIAAKRALRGDS
jgi:hypothetical protein